MIKRPILTVALATVTFLVTMAGSVSGDEQMKASMFEDFVSLFEDEAEPLQGSLFSPIVRLDPEEYDYDLSDITLDENVIVGKYGEWTYCQYEMPAEDEIEYNTEFVSYTIDEEISGGDVFFVEVEMVNTGNVRLFSEDANCGDFYPINMGTQYELDRASDFGTSDTRISGWLASNRIKMVEDYADPGETFHFQFQSIAPEGDDIHREWFQPVIEWVSWVGEPFYVDVVVGEPTEQMLDDIYFVRTASLSASELSGERNLEVNLSEQTMNALIGDTTIWTFPVSTGAYDTPTPTGNYQILNKQELRVGGEYPHYRMPYWQGWRTDGYGLHALPYLGSDGGAFWQEALSHIGIPVSHGCVRQLPEDAETLYEFTDIGTPLYIHH